MTGKSTSARPHQDYEPSGERELAAALAEQRQELLRLRDLLVARDTELGAARGRLTELESSPLHLMNATARLRSHIPGFLRRALRALRGRRR